LNMYIRFTSPSFRSFFTILAVIRLRPINIHASLHVFTKVGRRGSGCGLGFDTVLEAGSGVSEK
jgi:hypothetical protein